MRFVGKDKYKARISAECAMLKNSYPKPQQKSIDFDAQFICLYAAVFIFERMRLSLSHVVWFGLALRLNLYDKNV